MDRTCSAIFIYPLLFCAFMKKFNLDYIRKDLERMDKIREEVIRESRKVIISSKTAIGCVHRDELSQADKVLEGMKDAVASLKDLIKKNPRLEYEGIFKVAIQEYVEALGLLEFARSQTILPYREEFLDHETYLMGLCDLSGELVRKAINASLKENFTLSVRIREALEEIYIELSKFDLRNGELRRKYDGIKYDIKKLDDLVFELKMKGKI